MSWPAALLWIVILASALSRGPMLIYVTSISGIFMSLQMLPGEGGGINLLPQSVCAAMLVGKTMLQPGNMSRALEAALDPRRVGLFTAFLAFSVISALTLPRVFGGLIEVVPVSGFRAGTQMLAPISGNLNQTCYMALSYGMALSFSIIGSRQDVQRHYLLSLLFSSIALIASGLADLILYHAGLSALLDPFRTASYAMLTEVEAMGSKRVVGLTPEASTYGALSVSMLACLTFLRPFYKVGREQLVVNITAGTLLLMVALSTSSSAYIGLVVLITIYGIDFLVRALGKEAGRTNLLLEIWVIVLGVFAAFAVFVLVPNILAPLMEMVDKMLFQKTASASYIERSLWNMVGWQAFMDSGGLGVGLGSVRVSNWTISILASTGVFGGCLIFGHILQKLVTTSRFAPTRFRHLAYGLKLSIIPTLMIYQLGGTIPDVGITMASILGFLSASFKPSESSRVAAGDDHKARSDTVLAIPADTIRV